MYIVYSLTFIDMLYLHFVVKQTGYYADEGKSKKIKKEIKRERDEEMDEEQPKGSKRAREE